MRLWKTIVPSVTSLALTVALTALGPTNPAYADDDPLVGWQHDTIKSIEANKTTKGKGVIVSVIDSGVSEHPYFDDKTIVKGKSYGEGEGRNDYGDGHGTAMAGAILSVAPEASIMPMKPWVDDDFTAITAAEDAAKAIDWSIENGAQVINMSWGVSDDNPILRMAMQRAIEKDVILVAAAGNDGADVLTEDDVNVPAIYPGVIVVSATDQNNALASFSNHGGQVTIAAPGTNFRALKNQIPWDPDDVSKPNPDKTLYIENAQGTSPAAAIVSGVVALVLAAHPDLSANEVINRVLSTAKDLGDPGRDSNFGYGLVDANAAVTAEVNGTVKENPLGYPMGTPGDPDAMLAGPTQDVHSDAKSSADSEQTPVLGWLGSGVAAIAFGGAVAIYLLRRRRNPSAQLATAFTGAPPNHAPPQFPGTPHQQPTLPPTPAAQYPVPNPQYPSPRPASGRANVKPPPST